MLEIAQTYISAPNEEGKRTYFEKRKSPEAEPKASVEASAAALDAAIHEKLVALMDMQCSIESHSNAAAPR